MSDQQPGTATNLYQGRTEVPLGKLADEVGDKYDDVTKPSHYCEGRTLMPWDVIDDWGFDEDYYLASSLEYIARAGRKLYPGKDARESAIKDLGKAVQYINRKIAKLEERQ